MESTTNPIPDGNIGYLEFVGCFATSTVTYTISQAATTTTIANITADISTTGNGSFVVLNDGSDGSYIDISFTNGGGLPSGGLQVGGVIEIMVMTQLI